MVRMEMIFLGHWKNLGCPAEGPVFARWMNNLKRDHIAPQLKKEVMEWDGGTLFALALPPTCTRWEFLLKLH